MITFTVYGTLSDLLEWLEGERYETECGIQPFLVSGEQNRYWIELFKENRSVGIFKANTREDAAAEAVLWVLEREKESKHETLD